MIDITDCHSRKDIRSKLISTFLEEEPGEGTKDKASKYVYFVETLSDGRRVFLSRPAILNKGMDFIVNVENYRFYSNKLNKNGKYSKLPAPAHHNILSDLSIKKRENALEYRKLKSEIMNIFDVKPYSYEHISFNEGMSVEMLLALIKWLFIEQDVTYWNFSGRHMLMMGIEEI